MSFLNEVLKSHEALIGTVFGFGRDNSWLFEDKNHVKKISSWAPLWEEDVYDFFKNRPTFAWKWFGFCSDNLTEVLGYPTCLANPDSMETQALKERFLETRQKIIDYYKEKKFFETTLSILINGV
jgi:hypothetical protein